MRAHARDRHGHGVACRAIAHDRGWACSHHGRSFARALPARPAGSPSVSSRT